MKKPNKQRVDSVYSGMRFLVCAIVILAIEVLNRIDAAEPVRDLSEEVSVRLIGEMLEIRPSGISVATVTQGAKRSEDGFEERHVQRVTAIHPILQEGRMVRRVRCYDFF